MNINNRYKQLKTRVIPESKMIKKALTNLKVSYKWNGKDEPERLNRVYDMILDKIIKNLYVL